MSDRDLSVAGGRSLGRIGLLTWLLILLAARPGAAASPAWKALGPFGGTVTKLEVAPGNGGRLVYAMTEEGVFRTTDGGASWVLIHGPQIRSNLAMDPSRPGTLYLSTFEDKLLKSRDFGSHWVAVGTRGLEGFSLQALAVDPARPSRLYAAAFPPIPSYPDGGGIPFFRSTDGGVSWKLLPRSSSPRTLSGDAQLVAVRRPAGTVFVLLGGGLFRSTDAGDTWEPVRHGLPRGWVVALAPSPSDPETLYASVSLGEESGVFRSRGSGASWQRMSYQRTGPFAALAVSPLSAETVWAAGYDGLFVSFDGGARWRAIGTPEVRSLRTVALSPSTPRILYAGGDSNVVGENDLGGVFASEDGGATWKRRNQGLAGRLVVTGLTVDPATPGVLWAGLSGVGVFRSVDSGQEWRRTPLRSPSPADVFEINDLALAPSSPSTLYALSDRLLWRTEDGGDTWTLLERHEPFPSYCDFLRVSPVSAATLWSCKGALDLLESTDRGVTWLRRPLPHVGGLKELALSPSSPATMYAFGDEYGDPFYQRVLAWRSTDSGTTWVPVADGLGGSFPSTAIVDPVDSRLVYVGVCCESPILWKSRDGGTDWTAIGTGLKGDIVRALAASPVAGLLWVATDIGIFRSLDGGETWQAPGAGLPVGLILRLAVDPHDPWRVYAATSDGVWVLEDEP